MKILKRFVPIVALMVLAFYGYRYYPLLPQPILNAVIFLPVLLAVLVVVLSFRFGRSQVFFYTLLVVMTNVVLGMEWADSRLAYALLSAVVPILLVLLSLFPDRGVLTLRAWPSHLALLLATGFVAVAVQLQLSWLSQLLYTNWLPAQYFDWSRQPQSVIYVSVSAVIAMLVVTSARPTSQTSAGLGVLIMLITQLYFGGTDQSLHVFSSVALLMCLYAVLQESWRMAYLDELTELAGRRALRDRLHKIGGKYTISMLDIDHFKKFNDRFGHDTGDAVLRMIAGQLNKVTGGGAAFRYGGEEFTIVFNGKKIADVIPHLNALLEKIASTPFVINRANRRNSDNTIRKIAKDNLDTKQTVQVTISAGVADSQHSAVSGWEILKISDKALYRAKRKGRNCVSE